MVRNKMGDEMGDGDGAGNGSTWDSGAKPGAAMMARSRLACLPSLAPSLSF